MSTVKATVKTLIERIEILTKENTILKQKLIGNNKKEETCTCGNKFIPSYPSVLPKMQEYGNMINSLNPYQIAQPIPNQQQQTLNPMVNFGEQTPIIPVTPSDIKIDTTASINILDVLPMENVILSKGPGKPFININADIVMAMHLLPFIGSSKMVDYYIPYIQNFKKKEEIEQTIVCKILEGYNYIILNNDTMAYINCDNIDDRSKYDNLYESIKCTSDEYIKILNKFNDYNVIYINSYLGMIRIDIKNFCVIVNSDIHYPINKNIEVFENLNEMFNSIFNSKFGNYIPTMPDEEPAAFVTDGDEDDDKPIISADKCVYTCPIFIYGAKYDNNTQNMEYKNILILGEHVDNYNM